MIIEISNNYAKLCLRKWVIKNASVSTQANILLEIYGKVLNEK